ncbi:MAG: DUF3820 family protein [Gammaproteobacteria bacterium]|nr:DUF3820 family protein [Gammaproteobacteria bacterium]
MEKEDLVAIANMEMPFGKYKGTPLIRLPEPYLLWFAGEGFPAGKLGRLMELSLALKIEGLEGLVEPLREAKNTESNTTK